MQIVGAIVWWYSDGLIQASKRVALRLDAILDYFSIGLLLKTLFAPFRQISAGHVAGPIGVRWQAFIDRLVSRCIGAIVRSLMIIFGLVTLIISCIFGLVTIVCWTLIPLLPIAGLVMTIIGWTPSWL